ncbi:unnamed protein product [Blepharisma stoltei]|uniref:Ubiquitin-like domain-containing protein n=1 Tax=Blepharisma stoltei TaxID=1481888 RepID=A0AAU9IXM2_9CILI|nr:unnamed protein product [Blepharisma stoltei]
MLLTTLTILGPGETETHISIKSNATSSKLKRKILRLLNIDDVVMMHNGNGIMPNNVDTLQQLGINDNDTLNIHPVAAPRSRPEESKTPLISLIIIDLNQNEISINANPEWRFQELWNEIKRKGVNLNDNDRLLYDSYFISLEKYSEILVKKMQFKSKGTLRVLDHLKGGDFVCFYIPYK